MNVERCRVLVEVLAQGSMHAAAEALGYTPSGLSRAVSALEQELGLTLLVRRHGGVEATPACQELLPFIQRLLTASEASDEQVQALLGAEVGTVRLGTAYPELYPPLTEALARFAESRPAVRASLREGTSSELVALVETGELDLALVSKRPGRHGWIPLVEDELCALVPAKHELAQAAAYPLERLAHDPFIEIMPGATSDNSLVLTRLGIRPNVRLSVGDDAAGYAMVDAGLGVTLTNALHVRGRGGPAVALPTNPCVTVPIGIALSADAMVPAASAFAELAVPLLKERMRCQPPDTTQ